MHVRTPRHPNRRLRARAGAAHAAMRLLPVVVACAIALPVRADTGVGVDLWVANALHPDGRIETPCDERGMSWLAPYARRSPTGNPYACPPTPPMAAADDADDADWRYHGVLQVGALATGGDDDNAMWARYVDWDNGVVLGLLDLAFERPRDGSYANLRASRLSEDDQYYQAVFGRAGAYKVRAFLRDLPNHLSNNARSIWDGVGSNHLPLAGGLVPGASTPEEVAAASAAAPERRLSVVREKHGLGFSMYLSPRWTAYANASNERRRGARPFGGTFFFNYPFPDNGGVFETLRPVDDSTAQLDAGLRFAGPVWRMEFAYSGSFYRDRHTRFTYESPYGLYPVVPGAVSAPLTTGQFATEPDNDYHNLEASFTRTLPMDGEASLTASFGRMSQDDTLIAPIDCRGVFGIGLEGSLELGPQNPFLHSCADWNTPAALSRTSADMQIDTSLLDARIFLRPTDDLSLRGGLRFNREDYRNAYLAFNPLTGQYGYVTENGSQGSVVPGEIGFWDPFGNASNLTRVRSLPLDLQTIEATLGADWKLGRHDTLGATVKFNRFEPTNRERERVDDRSVKLTWVNRALEWLTLRANVTWLEQDGDRYDHDPYEFTFSSDLPGYVPPPSGVPAHTVEAMRKYDVSSRDQQKLDLMATLMPREDMTISASLHGDWNDYDAEIGRQRYDTLGFTVQWQWQPSPTTGASLFYGYDRARLGLANINEINDSGSDPTLGGSTYSEVGRWWVDDEQRNHHFGATFNKRFGRVRLDASWNRIDARGTTAYRFTTPAALAYFQDAERVPGNRFPDSDYRVDSITLGVTIPLMQRVALRVFDRYERGRISDWHYAGFDSGRVFDHRVYADGGPEGYSANLFGLLLDIALGPSP